MLHETLFVQLNSYLINSFCWYQSNGNFKAKKNLVMSGWVFLGLTSTKQWIKCLAQGHNTVTPLAASLKLTILSIPNPTLYQLSHCPSLIMEANTMNPDQTPEQQSDYGPYCLQIRLPQNIDSRESK